MSDETAAGAERTPGPAGSRKRPRRKTPAEAAPGPEAGAKPGPGAPSAPAAKSGRPTAKSEQTRALILETAMRLFQERGYDRTTMRAIAQEAGVSVGNAYYYFASKEHLIQGFYDRIAAEHTAAVEDVLARETDLAGRLSGVLLTWLDIAAPYHEFAAQFFKNAADPASPLSPFSDESQGPRATAIALHRQVLAGAKVSADPELTAQLPQLLWLQQMGVVLFWVHDRSPGCARTRRLVERTSPLVARAIAASRFRVLRPLIREVTDVLAEFLLPTTDRAPDPPAGRRDAKNTP
ncbi:TetR/AcrR family transcriptional regulator [Streptomyces pinistramenti]|uniref:TetR/AcrR family transcriptional regulator n=1 Tax=Streptomyces pinistramenti TaxID=2884812 RepID=UPI001D08D1BA|nr:TetR family transcriptional regulator [Streptomyces pinistramenti]MCB5909545.1 TetR family transcriptional regulator [Streptomyces pinistramenti]